MYVHRTGSGRGRKARESSERSEAADGYQQMTKCINVYQSTMLLTFVAVIAWLAWVRTFNQRFVSACRLLRSMRDEL